MGDSFWFLRSWIVAGTTTVKPRSLAVAARGLDRGGPSDSLPLMNQKESPMPSQPSRFIALDIARKAAIECDRLVKKLRSPYSEHRSQLVRATNGIVNCLAESNGRFGKDRSHLRKIAYGSILESKARIETLVALDLVDVSAAREAWKLLDRCGAMAWQLIQKG